ncbi:uncharacterized protein LOC122854224 [Aphidius gifuensis]|uniref:uncharacterized protein LOC122854224 n=1 Tax=Aphidius gifuensis TaxID=684658 RepID=UPI001CDBEF03|nr:uncharacterized protein LOC122854224 [Aphidius gifuensis]
MDKIIQFILRFSMMNNNNILLVVILFFFIISICFASKCTETRKSHATSCTIYYDCINLPDGGYVWVPSKCPDGLVFQGYLGVCVLPGDTWNCDDTKFSHKLPNKNQFTQDLIDQTKINYHEINPTLINSTVSNNFDNLFPLIEIKQILNDNNKNNKQDDKSSILINSQEKIKTSASRLYFFINFGTYLNNKKNILTSSIVENPSKNVFIKMIKNYMLNNRKTENEIIKKNQLIRETTTEESIQNEMISSTTMENPTQLMIDETNHIVAIIGNLGEKQYVTIEQYKELSNSYNVEIIDVIPCVSEGTRLPNLTDCARYYTCDPNTAIIHEFRCPPQTAFNKRTNFCDTKKYKSCIKNRNNKSTTIEQSSTSFSITEKLLSFNDDDNNNKEKQQSEYYCESTGKFPDQMSDKYYYFCYLSKNLGTIESMKMSCPNDLIFCQDRKVCTAKKLCHISD